MTGRPLSKQGTRRSKLIFVVTEDWYFCSHRLQLAMRAQKAGFDVTVITRESQFGDDIRANGIRLIPLDLHRGKVSALRDMFTVFSLWRILHRERPDVIHNVALKPVILGTLAARMARVGSVVNALAGLGYAFTSSDWKARLLRFIARFAFRILFQSASVQVIVQNVVDEEIVRDLGISAERIKLIAGSGVDLASFRPSPEPNHPITVAIVSRMLRDKGVGELVDAARILRQGGYSVVVRLVGPVDPENPSSISESTLLAWNREGIVEWLGPTSDIAGVWANAHICVLPSYREGLPKSLLEAAACGRPIITTDVPGCRDVVIHNQTGLLIPPRDSKALAEAIVRLAEDADLRARLGIAARSRVKSHFSIDEIVEQTLAVYRSVRATA
ncbi:MAG: glycosyltransferase family 4 protein [Gammaproteobacteria bacterium]|nr:glycosyltransferase family 4 protein [Gammaproteobacteria bacterium]MDH3411206.1 glycosyltransferase family 4 protein [Gammaproteobacteria bacterium]